MTVSATTGTTTSSTTSSTTSKSTSSTTSSSSSSSTSGVEGTQAWTTFLTLLTAQLKNQNPINPTDTDQMTQELIGLSQLEQQMSSNTLLSSMKSSLNDISAANGLGYIGSSVVANGSTAPLVNDSATWDYTLANTAKTTTLTIENSSGQTVWTGTGSTASGSHTLNWDGLATNGTTQEAAGAYTLYVSAVDSSGKAITTSTQITGTVTGVDNSSGSANLILGNSVTVAQSSVVGVSSSSSTASTSSTSSTSGS